MIDWGDQIGGYVGGHRVIGLLSLEGIVSVTTETIVTVSSVEDIIISALNQRDILITPDPDDIVIAPARDDEIIIV